MFPFSNCLGTDSVHLEVADKELFRKISASVYLHYRLSVYTVLFKYKHLAFYYVIFIFYEYIILLIYFCYIYYLCYFVNAFTTPFLNKVFLELYMTVVYFLDHLDC